MDCIKLTFRFRLPPSSVKRFGVRNNGLRTPAGENDKIFSFMTGCSIFRTVCWFYTSFNLRDLQFSISFDWTKKLAQQYTHDWYCTHAQWMYGQNMPRILLVLRACVGGRGGGGGLIRIGGEGVYVQEKKTDLRHLTWKCACVLSRAQNRSIVDYRDLWTTNSSPRRKAKKAKSRASTSTIKHEFRPDHQSLCFRVVVLKWMAGPTSLSGCQLKASPK